ncbi:glutathione S-transferase [Psychromonas marina]|uniref:Glutathione S-transferase n=1 Tax=Psychromonas marina TaxID=88364 RepID=A0ABQ6E3A8_9GAMM|nr:glutathione S-transferase N-terminal domain-containing protein [Psychromonas marina]GLS91471.1 glutathione S-transferase [Psychromonas marina]
MELIVGTDSTWSLRAWICLQLVNVDVTELVIDLNSANYKSEILKYSPTGLVPALINETCVIHDSLAITEYLNESFNGKLYPKNITERALARSLCAEMHSGFMNLRSQCPFTLKAVSNNVDISENMSLELGRIEAIFEQAEIPFMSESASAVDAFYSILAFRLKSYGVNFQGKAGEYQDSLLNWSLLKKAIMQAEQWHSAYK